MSFTALIDPSYDVVSSNCTVAQCNFLVTALIALETSLFVAVKDSPPSDRCSDSLSVAAFDWASLLLVPSFPEASRISFYSDR